MTGQPPSEGCDGTGFELVSFWDWFFRGSPLCKGCDHPECPSREGDAEYFVRCSSCGAIFPSEEETADDVCPRCGVES